MDPLHIEQLDQFHMQCLRNMQHKMAGQVSNVEVLEKCKIPGIKSLLLKAQLRWLGHVARMKDSRLPKAILYSQLKDGTQHHGRPLLHY